MTPVLLAHLPRQMPWTITENPASTIQPPHNCTVDQEKRNVYAFLFLQKTKIKNTIFIIDGEIFQNELLMGRSVLQFQCLEK